MSTFGQTFCSAQGGRIVLTGYKTAGQALIVNQPDVIMMSLGPQNSSGRRLTSDPLAGIAHL